MLGQPIAMLIPDVIGFRLTGKLPEGATATDLVLTVTQMLRRKGVVGKFVEFFGPGLDELGLADRATVGNMAPEYGATCGFFPVDKVALDYLHMTGRDEHRIALVEAYLKAQGMFREPGSPEPVFTDTLELDLCTVVPSLAGPKRPQDRVALKDAASRVQGGADQGPRRAGQRRRHAGEGRGQELRDHPRRRGDRGDHLVHQHVEPVGAGRRRPGRAQGARQGAAAEAVGEDVAGARLAGGHRIPGKIRPAGRPGRDRLQPGGLRLHHLHRQLRPAGGRDRRCDRGQPTGRRRGAVRQPQLRGPRACQRARQLSRLAAAGGGLCAARQDDRGHHHGAARHRQRRQAGVSARRVADQQGDRRHHRRLPVARAVPQALRRGDQGPEAVAGDRGRYRQRDLSLVRRLDLREEPALFRGHHHGPAAGRRHQRRAHPGRAG